VGNDPVNLIDPSGMDQVKCVQRDNGSPVCTLTPDDSENLTLIYVQESTTSLGEIYMSTISRTFKGTFSEQTENINSQISTLCNCSDGDRVVDTSVFASFENFFAALGSVISGGNSSDGKRGRGSNRSDRKMIDDAARQTGITDRRGFGKFIEREKKLDGKRGDENYSYDELLDLAKEYKGGGR
jgi:hypothetical protein